MKNYLETPISAVIFDCDGTLSTIEGIDALAEKNGVLDEVAALTEKAMGVSGLTAELYAKRLSLVKPTLKQALHLGDEYFSNCTHSIANVIATLQCLQKAVYIISAGLSPAVKGFGHHLQIPEENIFAVDIYFDDHGNYSSFDKTSPLITNEGKRVIIQQLKKNHPQLIHIGDGLNDLSAKNLVTRFIGYGGVNHREIIAKQCDFYLRDLSPTTLLPLLLTQAEYKNLIPIDEPVDHLLTEKRNALTARD